MGCFDQCNLRVNSNHEQRTRVHKQIHKGRGNVSRAQTNSHFQISKNEFLKKGNYEVTRFNYQNVIPLSASAINEILQSKETVMKSIDVNLLRF